MSRGGHVPIFSCREGVWGIWVFFVFLVFLVFCFFLGFLSFLVFSGLGVLFCLVLFFFKGVWLARPSVGRQTARRRRPTTAASHANQARRGSQAQPKKTKKSKTPNKQKTTKNQKTPKTKKTKKPKSPQPFQRRVLYLAVGFCLFSWNVGAALDFGPLRGGEGVRINLALCRINPARVLVCSFACM